MFIRTSQGKVQKCKVQKCTREVRISLDFDMHSLSFARRSLHPGGAFRMHFCGRIAGL